MSLAKGGSPKGTQLRAIGSRQPWQEWHESQGGTLAATSVHYIWLG